MNLSQDDLIIISKLLDIIIGSVDEVGLRHMDHISVLHQITSLKERVESCINKEAINGVK